MEVKSYINPLVEIRNSPISGKGMFAKEKIPKGTIIIRWGGTFVHGDKLPKDRTKYIIIQVDEDLWSIEPKAKPEDESYFINHSCNPNVWMVDGITFVAARDIKKGEELTTDYSLFEKEEYVAKWKCSCGAKECRKEITGKDYLIPALQKKYGEHFSPVIKKKIK